MPLFARVRKNVLLQYSIVTLILTLVMGVITGTLLGQRSKAHLVATHLDLYPALIHHITEDDPEMVSYFTSPRGRSIPPSLENHMEMLYGIESVFRITVWNRNNVVLWSDREELIGKSFPEKNIIQKVSEGELGFELIEPDTEEHEFEEAIDLFLEIYIPIMNQSDVIGAIEIYESDERLNTEINQLVRTHGMIVGISGLVLYLLLFSIFARAYRRQKQITEQVKKTEQVTIYALAYQAGLRDEETGRHLKRTSEYVRIIAEELMKDKEYSKYISKSYIEDLVKSAPLHDIGKVGIEDQVLRKPGKLTDEEYEKIKNHSELGARILEDALEDISFRSFLDIAIHLVRYHHERWDGKGYPRGLKGLDIPISARIMAIADVYDALRSQRYYKSSFSHEKSVAIITAERGKQFDPKVVDAFLKHAENFRMISESMADTPEGHLQHP